MPNNTIGWGQGAVNNSNGWGKGASNSTDNWGDIHAKTFGHDETNLTGGGGLIYGLQFNGVSDTVDLSSQLIAISPLIGNYNVNFEFTFTDTESTPIFFGGFTGGTKKGFTITCSRTAGNVHLIFQNDVNYSTPQSFSGFSQGDIIRVEGIFNAGNPFSSSFTVNGNSADGANAGRFAGYTTGTFILGANNNSFYYNGVIIKSIFGSIDAQDSTSWAGGTINGATRVQSTDGGQTWTPA